MKRTCCSAGCWTRSAVDGVEVFAPVLTHCVIKVVLDGKRYLVDAGFLPPVGVPIEWRDDGVVECEGVCTVCFVCSCLFASVCVSVHCVFTCY